MKTTALVLLGCSASLLVTAQNTFPSNGKVGIKTTSPQTDLDVVGDAYFRDTLKVGKKLRIGTTPDQIMTIKFVPGTATYPAQFKISAPAGSKPIRGNLNGGIGNEDSSPNFDCFEGVPIPPVVNALSHAVSITYNPVNQTVPGGQIVMGHNGVSNFFESQSVATTYPTNLNHPGDLFINRHCNRNVLFFSHGTPFGIGQKNIVSIDGNLNVRVKMQIGVTGNSFVGADKLYVNNPINGGANGIKIKHGSGGFYGLQIATYNDAAAILVNYGSTFAADGPEAFRVDADGKTSITTPNTDAFVVKNATSGVINFKVKNTGYVYAREINVLPTSITFPDYVFSDTYRLRSIDELDTYVKQHKHLPDLPSADEVKVNGINLAELQVKQLEKVEEAFLYIVQLKKENDELKRRLAALEAAK